MNLIQVVVFVTAVVLVSGGSQQSDGRTSSDIAEDAELNTVSVIIINWNLFKQNATIVNQKNSKTPRVR